MEENDECDQYGQIINENKPSTKEEKEQSLKLIAQIKEKEPNLRLKKFLNKINKK